MTYPTLTLFFILVSLIVISGFFSAAEIGIMSLNRYRLRHLVKKGNKKAARVNQLLAHPDKLLSVVLIGNNIANITASMLATLIGQYLYQDAGVAIATFLLTLVILVFAEMTPKTLAALYPQKVAFASARLLTILQVILTPLVKIISGITNGILRIFGVSSKTIQKETLSNEELRSVMNESGGLLPVEHKSMLISLLDLEQARVEDILVPKAEIVGIDLEQPWHELLEQLETAQHTRLPLYRGSIDNIEGIIHIRKILNLVIDNELNMESLINSADPPYYVPEATPLNVQILNFQKMKTRISFVVDEYGELQGLITMEDILEEVVGEFTTDISALSKDITRDEDGSFIINASITLRNLNRLLNWQLPSLGPRTLSGLIIEYLGYIPPSDCCLKIKNYKIEILKVSGNTIKSVRMKVLTTKKF